METKEQAAGNALIGASARVKSSTAEIDALLKQRTQSAALVEDIAGKVEAVLLPTIQACESKSIPAEEAQARLLQAAKAVVSQLKASAKSLSGDAAHLKGYADGIAAAAKMVESMGTSLLREDERVRELAASDASLDEKRRIGERPEHLRVKRKVAQLRAESEVSPENSEGAE